MTKVHLFDMERIKGVQYAVMVQANYAQVTEIKGGGGMDTLSFVA